MVFFDCGLTMACFWLSGSTPSKNDALQMLAIVPDSTGHSRLTSQISVESEEYCLSGEPMMIFETLHGVVGPETSRTGVARGWNTATGEFCVALRMESTLFRK